MNGIHSRTRTFRLKKLNSLWSITDFPTPDVRDFAQRHLVGEVRRGLITMSILLLGLVAIALLLLNRVHETGAYTTNYGLVMALAVHINVSSRLVKDINTLNMLGMTLLIISATAFVLIAHQLGEFTPLLLANIVLLFMIIPMIPWGLREAGSVILIIYSLLTVSAGIGPGRFDSEMLWTLQFFMVAAGVTSLVMVFRGIVIRKKEIISNYEWQKAHADLLTLSHQDPLTGAWNRRYIKPAHDDLSHRFAGLRDTFHFIIFDLDEFKRTNDTYGHDFGDRVLVEVSHAVEEAIGEQGHLIRLGGDEFVILSVHDDPGTLMATILEHAKVRIAAANPDAPTGLTWGVTTAPFDDGNDLENLYRRADQVLYANKQRRKSHQHHGEPAAGRASAGVRADFA